MLDDKSKKLEKQINQWSCINNFLQKILTRAFFLLAPAANPWLLPDFFSYWLHETAACCYFGVDLGNGLDHNSLSRSADGTPYSSSDLPYLFALLFFSLLLGRIILSPTPFLPFLGRKFSKSNSSFLSSWRKLF